MKKAIIVMLASLMAMSMISCGADSSSTADSSSSEATTTAPVETEAQPDETEIAPEETEAPPVETEIAPEESSSADSTAAEGTPLATLNTIWASYQEGEKFAVIGGDFSEANNNPEGPGKYDLADAEAVDGALGMPQASVAKLDDAASMVHMMNANTFTGGAFLVKDGEDVNAIVQEMNTNIMNRQWMCGFPDKLVIYTIDNQIISAFGALDLIDTFKAKVTAAYPDAVLAVDAAITG